MSPPPRESHRASAECLPKTPTDYRPRTKVMAFESRSFRLFNRTRRISRHWSRTFSGGVIGITACMKSSYALDGWHLRCRIDDAHNGLITISEFEKHFDDDAVAQLSQQGLGVRRRAGTTDRCASCAVMLCAISMRNSSSPRMSMYCICQGQGVLRIAGNERV